MLSQQRLKELLSYDHETGLFTCIVSRSSNSQKGSVAGCKYSNSYIYIKIDGKKHLSHRLAWLYIYGNFPESFLDHINEIKNDNRICNLRLSTNQENTHNVSKPHVDNKSGYLGVSWNKREKRWKSFIGINGKNKYIGYFNSPEEAYDAYLKAKRELHLFWVEDKFA